MKVSVLGKRRMFAGRTFNPSYVVSIPKGWDKVEAGHETFFCTVVRKKDGVVVAENVSVSEADVMIAKAKAGKKAALMIK